MKILLTHFQIQDYGGIINYSEFLAQGLKELGHTVDSLTLKNKGKSGFPNTKDRSNEEGWEYGEGLGLWMHQKKGWEGMYQLNYKTDYEDYLEESEEYDLIIHVIPVPTCSKQTLGDDYWLKLFEDCFCPQVAVVHDGNMQKLYPHLYRLCGYLDGLICVHDAAYNSCDVLPIRRKLIPNPHNYNPSKSITPISKRENGIVSLQTFKRWKRVDDLIRAIPHMDEFSEKIICGGGIEYHYMTSDTKCKPEYKDEHGNRIWDNALDSSMDYLGYVTTSQRDNLLSKYKLLIDPSWSKSYSKLGAHFNRVLVEAMSLGCIPVCTDLGMSNSSIFKRGVNYLELPYDCPPHIYGKMLEEWLNDEELLSTIQSNNLQLMYKFAKNNIAKDILDFSMSNNGEVGIPSLKLKSDSDRKMSHFEEL